MEQNFDPNIQLRLPQPSNRFPTWATILIIVVVIALAVGIVIYSFVKKDKEVANNNLISPNSLPIENQTTSKPTEAQNQITETEDWKTYQNASLKFSFKYPGQLGTLEDRGRNAYFINNFTFSGETSVNKIYIGTFTDKSVVDWETGIEDALKNDIGIGDPITLSYPLSVKNLLTSKAVGYDCTADFNEFFNYLDKQDNESCNIVSINGIKAFKIVTLGPFFSEYSELKYLFYVNETWFDFSKTFLLFHYDDPNKPFYTYEQMNAILQGKMPNAAIQAEIDIFNKIVSTVEFN